MATLGRAHQSAARWIQRRARERRDAVHEELKAYHGVEAVTVGLDTASGSDRSAVTVYPPSAQARQRAKPYLPSPPPPTSLDQELARLADGQPQHWTSPLRDELLAQGWIVKLLKEDGRWAGDQITKAGLERLSRSR